MNITRHCLTAPLLIGFAIFLSGCSSSPPPNAGTGIKSNDKMTDKSPAETFKNSGEGKTEAEEKPEAKAAAAALEKSGAKLVRRKGAVVRVELGNEGSDADLALLKDLPTVEALVADKRGVTDKGLESLAGHPALKTLDLALSGITNAGLAHLPSCPRSRKSTSNAVT